MYTIVYDFCSQQLIRQISCSSKSKILLVQKIRTCGPSISAWLKTHLLHSSPTIATFPKVLIHHSSMAICRDTNLAKTPRMLVYGLIFRGLGWSEYSHSPPCLLRIPEALTTKHTKSAKCP